VDFATALARAAAAAQSAHVHSASASTSTADHQYRNGAIPTAAAAAIHNRQAKNIGNEQKFNNQNHFHQNSRRRGSSSPPQHSDGGDDEEEGQYERIPSAIPRPKPPRGRPDKPPVVARSNARQQSASSKSTTAMNSDVLRMTNASVAVMNGRLASLPKAGRRNGTGAHEIFNSGHRDVV